MTEKIQELTNELDISLDLKIILTNDKEELNNQIKSLKSDKNELNENIVII